MICAGCKNNHRMWPETWAVACLLLAMSGASSTFRMVWLDAPPMFGLKHSPIMFRCCHCCVNQWCSLKHNPSSINTCCLARCWFLASQNPILSCCSCGAGSFWAGWRGIFRRALGRAWKQLGMRTWSGTQMANGGSLPITSSGEVWGPGGAG